MKYSTSTKTWAKLFIIVALSAGAHAAKTKTLTSPLSKVIELMTKLQQQVITEGETAQATYQRYSAWCEKTSKEKQHEITEAEIKIEEFQVSIEKGKSDAQEAQARTVELSGSIATDEVDLAAMALIRQKEKSDFGEMDQELTATIDTIGRAVGVLTKELVKAGLMKGTSFLQQRAATRNMKLFVMSLGELAETASGVSEDSRAKLLELLQTQTGGENQEVETTNATTTLSGDEAATTAISQAEKEYVVTEVGGEGCPSGSEITTEEECRAAGNSVGKEWAKRTSYGMPSGCNLAPNDQGRLMVYFNTQSAKAASSSAKDFPQYGKASPVCVKASAASPAPAPAAAVPAGAPGPAPAAYEAKSSTIILDLLEKMKKEVMASQEKMRKAELVEKQNFELTTQHITSRVKTQKIELGEQQNEASLANEKVAVAEKKLDAVKIDIAEDKRFLKKLQNDCMERASEYEREVTTREEELKVLAMAKKVVQGGTSLLQVEPKESADDEIDSASFMQVAMSSDMASAQTSARHNAGIAVVAKLKELASTEHSVVLAQLSNKVSAVLQGRSSAMVDGGNAADPFKRVIVIISDYIQKLQRQQDQDAQEKEFCDREMNQTLASKLNRQGRIETLSTRIEQEMADIGKMTQQKVMLLEEVKLLEESQAEMDGMRAAERVAHLTTSKEIREGMAAVQMALKILREFYSQRDDASSFMQDTGSSTDSSSASDSSVAASSTSDGKAIINLLEICASDFSKQLAEDESEEAQALAEYTKLTQENKREGDVKGKTISMTASEIGRVQKKITEFVGDRERTEQELNSIIEYLEKITKKCVAQPISLQDKLKRIEREIEGLKAAQTLLMAAPGGQPSFLAFASSAAEDSSTGSSPAAAPAASPE